MTCYSCGTPITSTGELMWVTCRQCRNKHGIVPLATPVDGTRLCTVCQHCHDNTMFPSAISEQCSRSLVSGDIRRNGAGEMSGMDKLAQDPFVNAVGFLEAKHSLPIRQWVREHGQRIHEELTVLLYQYALEHGATRHIGRIESWLKFEQPQ